MTNIKKHKTFDTRRSWSCGKSLLQSLKRKIYFHIPGNSKLSWKYQIRFSFLIIVSACNKVLWLNCLRIFVTILACTFHIWQNFSNLNYFLAVQNSSITNWLSHSLTFTFAIQRAILETCDHWDIWSVWLGDMTWPKNSYLFTYIPTHLPTDLPVYLH